MWTLPFIKNKPLPNGVDRTNGNHSLIELRNVVKNYKTAAGDFPALKGIDLDMKPVNSSASSASQAPANLPCST
jgi:hypothetical protein